MALTVAAIDDHVALLAGLETILAGADDIRIVGTAVTVDELITTLTPPPDVVLLDLRLADGSDPYDNVQAIKDYGSAVLVFSALDSPYLIRQALTAGVHGLVQKTAPKETIIDALRHAAAGKTYATADWASLIDADPALEKIDLTDRQREILELYAMGEPAKRVARIVGLARTTVQDHIDRIRAKYASLGRPADTKIDLLRRAMEDGFVKGPADG